LWVCGRFGNDEEI
jgi:tryptophanase